MLLEGHNHGPEERAGDERIVLRTGSAASEADNRINDLGKMQLNSDPYKNTSSRNDSRI